MTRTPSILIVEDDPTIARLLADELNRSGCRALTAADLQDVLGEFRRLRPDLIVMDVGLPGRSGYEWCERIRAESAVPMIFLSSRAESADILSALTRGADDYITKPFTMAVAVAKIHALLRRTYGFGAGENQNLHAGPAVLDPERMTVSGPDGQASLTLTELRILRILFRSAGRYVRRDTLCELLWNEDAYIDDNTLSVNVTRLRRKLDQVGAGGLISTKKGYGYGAAVSSEQPGEPGA